MRNSGHFWNGDLRNELGVLLEDMSDELPADLGRRFGDISDLPDELKNQLQAARVGELEQEIIAVLDELHSVANVDEILVGLYRRQDKIHTRQYIANKLYRMVASGQIESVPKKKGVYRTK
jgi:hypothetical protein